MPQEEALEVCCHVGRLIELVRVFRDPVEPRNDAAVRQAENYLHSIRPSREATQGSRSSVPCVFVEVRRLTAI